MDVSIICPLYNAEKYLVDLHNNILMQKDVSIESINYIVTKSNDATIDICSRLNCTYKIIEPNVFSHSRTREDAAFNVKGDIIVLITQDIKIIDEHWLYNLIKDITLNKCDAAFSRQISEYNDIEKYIRMENYPSVSRIVSKYDLNKLGLMTFFFSDASAAIKKRTFKELKGYDNKDIIISEDMYLAYKLIMNGYKIKYCAESIVIHSHKLTSIQLFKRYFDTGVFFADNKHLKKYNINDGGYKLAISVIRNAFKDNNIITLLNIIPNFSIRFIGMKLGENYKRLPKKIIKKCTANINYWIRRWNCVE